MNNHDDDSVMINSMDPLHKQMKKQGSSRARSSRKSSTNNNYQFTNMAEARREVALALQLHRSTSSSSSSSAHHHNTIHHANSASPTIGAPAGGGSCNYPATTPTAYCYSAVDTLPVPGPVWSTTSPAILAQPLPLPQTVLASPATTVSSSSSTLLVVPESQYHHQQQAAQLEYCYCGGGGGQSNYYDQALVGSSTNCNFSCCYYDHASSTASGDTPDWWTSLPTTTADGGVDVDVSEEVSRYFDQYCYSAAEFSAAGISPVTGGRLSTMEEKPGT